MNMHGASRLGWNRSASEASSGAPGRVADPAQADSAAAAGRVPADAGARCSVLGDASSAKRGGLSLLAAALLLIPGLALADVPVATISGPETVVEGGTATYTVSLTGGGAAPIDISYEVTGTATEGVDYTLPTPSGTVTVPATTDKSSPNTTATIAIAITDDDVQEVGETLVVTLRKATTTQGAAAIGSPNQVTTTIRSDETVLVKIDDASEVTESDTGEADFTVTVTVPTDVTFNNDDITLGYRTVAGTATAGKDFTAAEANARVDITGASAERNGTINVAVLDDMLAEGDETFTVMLTLVEAPGNVAFERSTAKGTIRDDVGDTLTVTVVSDHGVPGATPPVVGTVLEGSAATFTVTVGGGTSSEDVVVSYTVSDGSVTGEVDEDDYEAPSGTLTIPAGQTTGSITIMTTPDDELEPEETLKVTLTGASTESGSITEPDDTAEVKVADRGHKVTVSVSDITVDEGEEAVFTVELSGLVSQAVSLQYVLAGTVSVAEADKDYENSDLPQTIEIELGKLAATFTVQTREDVLVEGPETLTLTLQNPPAQVGLRKATGTATINDANRLTASLVGPNLVPEGSPAVYTVELDGGTNLAPVMVDYTVTGTATSDAGFQMPSGKLEIAADTQSAQIVIDTIADQEVGETLVVTLTGATTVGAVSLGTPYEVTSTTVAADNVSVSVAATDGELDEDTDNSEVFTVTLTGGVRDEVIVVDYAVGGDVTVDDYDEASSGTLRFETTQASKELTFTATNDSLEEPDETIEVTLSLASQTVNAVLARATASATIAKSDPLTANVTADQANVLEGSDASFTVALTGGESTADVVVSYKVSGNVDTADYSGGGTGRLTIPASLSAGTIVITTVDDSVPETEEQLSVTLTSATTDGRQVSFGDDPEVASVPIASVDDGPVQLSVKSAGPVDEGGEAVFTVTLEGQVSGAVDVAYETEDGTATSTGANIDYTAIASTTTSIPAGESTVTIKVMTTDDSLAESPETFNVRLPEDDNTLDVGTERATATIRDNEALKVSLSGPQTVNVGATSATYTVTLTGGTGTAPIMVSYREGSRTDTATITTGTSTTFDIDPSARTKNQTFTVELTGASTTAGSVSVDRSGGAHRVTTRVVDPSDETVSVTVGSATLQEQDGQTATFTVSISTAVAEQTVVRYTVGGTATAGRDYTASTSGTLTIPANQTAATDTIVATALDDDLAEGDETITVTLSASSLPDGVTLGTARATATIQANDTLTARVVRQGPTVIEGATTTFTVELEQADNTPGAGSESVVVNYTTADSTATEDEDYTAPSGKLTIRAEQTKGTIQIRTHEDEVLESSETLVVALDGDPTTTAGTVNAAAANAGGSATTTIAERQGTVLLSVKDAGIVDEGRRATFLVTLSGPVSAEVPVGYETEEGTATNADYDEVSSGTTSIPAGETTTTITVGTEDDLLAEPSETFSVILPEDQNDSLPVGVAIDSERATATIRDNEALKVSLSGPQTVNVGATSATYTVTLADGTGTAPIMISYRDGSRSGTATITTGDTVTFDIDPSARAKNATFTVELTGASTTAGSVSVDRSGGAHRVTTRVVDPSDETVSVTVGSATLQEQDGQTATFTVSISTAVAEQTVVRYTVGGTATAGRDYTASTSGTLTIPANQTAATDTIVATALDDDLAEGDETITVTLSASSLPDGVTLGAARATATIQANDTLTARVVRESPTIKEGETTTFTVELEQADNTPGAGSENVVVNYTTADSTATEDEDYTAPSGKLTIRSGQTRGTIQIRTHEDEVLESGETLVVALDGNPTTAAGTVNAAAANAGGSATTTILDLQSKVLVTVADIFADEGEEAVFTATLSGPVSVPVTFNYQTQDGSATVADEDYEAVANTDDTNPVEIPALKTTATFTVKTTEDELAEASETFTVQLTLVGPTGTDAPDVEFRATTATATITDDALTATIKGPATVDEGDPAVYTVSVSGSGGSDEEITVTYSTEGSTATPTTDFSPTGGTLVFGGEDLSKTFTIQVVEDQVPDLGEKLVVSLTAETAAGDSVRAGTPATTRIVDDDGPVEVSVEADREIVAEGQEATFTVTMTGTVAEEPVTLRYQTEDGTATAPADYTAADDTITISAGETSATIAVPTEDDRQDELTDETFTIVLSGQALPDGVTIDPDNDTATIRITDHTLEASVSAPATVNEGESVAFAVSLTPAGQNRSGFAVDYDLGGNAVAPGDYTGASSGTLTIPEDQDSRAITIATEDDGVLDPGETLSVTLSNPRTLDGGLAALGSPTTATVEIVDQQTVTWSVEDVTIDENQDAVFTVTLDGLVQDAVTLTYATADGTATAGRDYTAVSNGRVTVAGGSTSATFTVQVTDDSNGEASETFTVQLTRSTAPAGVEPQSATATATIRDNDLALKPLLDVTVTEGGQEDIRFELKLVLQEQVLLGYSIAGTATWEEDYKLVLPGGINLQAPQGAIPIPADTPGGMVTVVAEDDAKAEGDEQFTVTLTTVNPDGSPGIILGQVTVTIEDNDELSVSVTAPRTVAEGDIARFTVQVGGAESTAAVNVSYSLGGTAKAPDDYSAPNPTMVSIPAGEETATIAIQTKADKVLEVDETLVVTLDSAATANGAARVGSPKSATTSIQDPAYHSINRVNQALLPGVVRASTASALEAIGWRMAEGAAGDSAAAADLAGLTGLYRALQANEYALQDGSYDLAKVLGGSSFLVPLSSHDAYSEGGVGFAVWGSGDFRTIGGGVEDAVKWDGSLWAARVGADVRFVDSLLTGMVVSYASGALDYTDAIPRDDREGTYGTWLVSVHPYVGWTTPDFGLWASGGFGRGGLTVDDTEYDAQETDITQWSVGGGGSVTLVSGDWLVAGGTTALKLKADGFLATATAEESENRLLQELSVGVNQVRAAIEASHAQYFAGGGSLRPTLEIGGRYDGGDGETGAGLEVGGGLTYADAGSGLTVGAAVRALVLRENYGEWGLSGLLQWDPDAAGHGLMMSVRPTIGVTASGVNGLWEHGTLELLSDGQPGGRVEAEIGYGLPAFGMTGVLTPFAGAALTDAGAYSLSVGGRLELSPAFDLTLEAERSEGTDPNAAPEHDVTLEGSFRW